MGNYDKAEAFYKRALKIAESDSNSFKGERILAERALARLKEARSKEDKK